MIDFIKNIIEIIILIFSAKDAPGQMIDEVMFCEPDLRPAIALIKKWEGFRSHSYRDSVGKWTIGFGSTVYPNGKPVGPNESISNERACEYLEKHIEKHVQPYIDKYVKAPLNNNQYCALVSFVYNLGGGALQRSTLLKKLNARDYNGAAREFDKWVKAGGKRLLGLVRRRDDEQALFLQPKEGVVNV